MKQFAFIILIVCIYHTAHCSCPTNYETYMGQCFLIIKGQVDYITAEQNCSQVNGNLLFTKTQLGWNNLVNSGWDIADQMWFGLTYDSNTKTYSFDDNSPYNFNNTSFSLPWADPYKAQYPTENYEYANVYCVQVQPGDYGLALFVTPCTDLASAVCIIGTLETNGTQFSPPPPPPPKNGAENHFYFSLASFIWFLLVSLLA